MDGAMGGARHGALGITRRYARDDVLQETHNANAANEAGPLRRRGVDADATTCL